MSFEKTNLLQPIEPEIDVDGKYAYCTKCFCELNKEQTPCPECGQSQDWSWLKDSERSIENENKLES